jgi:ferritin-like protein
MSHYHEPSAELDAGVRDAHRALVSLQEEIEAVDWYHQRMVCCSDPELRRVLEHNRNEEIEHAAMLVEWLRRVDPAWDSRLRKVLFTERPLGPEPDAVKGSSAPASERGRGLGVGSLRGEP